jgi:hypothetical protein
MTDNQFSQTPLFQINLLIFLGWRSTPAFVKPIFREEGFQLYRVGPSIPISLQARTRAANVAPPIPFQLAPTPDLLYRKNKTRQFIPIECKVSSFGPDTEQAKQAAALLTCTGSHLAETFGLSAAKSWSSTLLYAVSEGQTSAMRDTLANLAGRLQVALVETTPCGVLGIAIRSDGVYLFAEPSAVVPLQVLQGTDTGIRVMKLEEGEDPRPLYLIPFDPSCQIDEEYQKRALEERTRVALAALIGSQLDKKQFVIQMDDLMRATIEVWDVWAEKNTKVCIKNAVRVYARQVFQYIRKLGLNISVYQDEITFHDVTPSAASQVRNYLKSAAFRQGQIDLISKSVQLDFSSLAEGW